MSLRSLEGRREERKKRREEREGREERRENHPREKEGRLKNEGVQSKNEKKKAMSVLHKERGTFGVVRRERKYIHFSFFFLFFFSSFFFSKIILPSAAAAAHGFSRTTSMRTLGVLEKGKRRERGEQEE